MPGLVTTCCLLLMSMISRKLMIRMDDAHKHAHTHTLSHALCYNGFEADRTSETGIHHDARLSFSDDSDQGQSQAKMTSIGSAPRDHIMMIASEPRSRARRAKQTCENAK